MTRIVLSNDIRAFFTYNPIVRNTLQRSYFLYQCFFCRAAATRHRATNLVVIFNERQSYWS